MSANERRSGFRLPWLADAEQGADGQADEPAAARPADPSAPEAAPSAAASGAEPSQAASNGASPPAQPAELAAPPPATAAAAAATPRAAEPTAAPAPSAPEATAADVPAAGEPPSDFLRELVTAMRKVADEARTTGVDKLRSQVDEAVRSLEADAERRRQELRERAEADVTAVDEWARAEAERIKVEAEQRVAARRGQLEQQLAAEGTRIEAEARALRARVDEYERELEAYYAQLAEINDPAAFAAAAKRMPSPPALAPRAEDAAAGSATATASPEAGPTPEPGPAPEAADEVHPAEEVVLAARLAELDEKLEAAPAAAASPARPEQAAETATPVTTDVVVKGLGSFGAITGFRQSLSAQPGISAVALSLGQSGEFVFRATHAPGFDVGAVIKAMEGDGANIEPRPEGGLRVTLERAR